MGEHVGNDEVSDVCVFTRNIRQNKHITQFLFHTIGRYTFYPNNHQKTIKNKSKNSKFSKQRSFYK